LVVGKGWESYWAATKNGLMAVPIRQDSPRPGGAQIPRCRKSIPNFKNPPNISVVLRKDVENKVH
jgi:hypothetical protein